MTTQPIQDYAVMDTKWVMAIDMDRCTACQACVIACQEENNVPLNTDDIFRQKRAIQWIRVERYWDGLAEAESSDDPSKVKARFLTVPCQHCENAPCEPVCPVYATYHNSQGMNVQIYNRCIGTRYCQDNDPYAVRFFNFWEPVWPETFRNYLNPDVSVRSRGIMEKCTFCVQRVRKAEVRAKLQHQTAIKDGEVQPACVQTCPTNAMVFGNLNDPNSRIAAVVENPRGYRLLEEQGTAPNVVYLRKVDPNVVESKAHE